MEKHSYDLDVQERLNVELLRLRLQAKILFPLEEDFFLEDLNENARVLDLGCGNGAYLREVKNKFPSSCLRGFDRNQTLLDAAKNHFGIDCVNVDLLNSNLLEVGIRSFNPSVIFIRFVLQHLENQQINKVLTTVRAAKALTCIVYLIDTDDRRIKISPSSSIIAYALAAKNKQQACLGGDRAIGGRLQAVAENAGFDVFNNKPITISAVNIGRANWLEVFSPIMAGGILYDDAERQKLLNNEIESLRTNNEAVLEWGINLVRCR